MAGSRMKKLIKAQAKLVDQQTKLVKLINQLTTQIGPKLVQLYEQMFFEVKGHRGPFDQGRAH